MNDPRDAIRRIGDFAEEPLSSEGAEALLSILLRHAMEEAGARGAGVYLLEDAPEQPRLLAGWGSPVSGARVQRLLDRWSGRPPAAATYCGPGATVDAPPGAGRPEGEEEELLLLPAHRAPAMDRDGVAVVLWADRASVVSPIVRLCGDWIIELVGSLPVVRSPDRVEGAKQDPDDRELVHRINNALGAIVMHADLGSLVCESEGRKRSTSLFREIGGQAAICAEALRVLVRRL